MKLQRILPLALVLILTACSAAPASSVASPQPAPAKTELVVFAAASLTETLTELKADYEAIHPGVTIVCSFDSSGTLKTQIQEGAECDLFLSAGQKQMNQLDIAAGDEKNPEGLDFVDSETRIDLLENKVVLCVPAGNPKAVESFDDLARRLSEGELLLAVGNSDVPVGQYTQKIFTFYGLEEEALAERGVLTYGSNVKEVVTQVAEASVDCGIVYGTDAHSAGLTAVDSATAEMCGQVLYPAAVLKNAPRHELAVDFLSYLTTAEASAVFESVGFTPIN